MGLGTKYKPATVNCSGYKTKTILPHLKHECSNSFIQLSLTCTGFKGNTKDFRLTYLTLKTQFKQLQVQNFLNIPAFQEH
jgi:hypothetical protein